MFFEDLNEMFYKIIFIIYICEISFLKKKFFVKNGLAQLFGSVHFRTNKEQNA